MIQTILQFICSLSLLVLAVFSIQGLDFVLQANVYLTYSGYRPSMYGIGLIAASLVLLYTDWEMCTGDQFLYRAVDNDRQSISYQTSNRTIMSRRTLYEWKELIMVLITFLFFPRHNLMMWIILVLAALLFVAKASEKATKSGNPE